MESIQKKMLQLKTLKEAAQDKENALTNKLAELNDILKSRDDEILQYGKKIMHVENDLDSTTEKLLKANLDIEQAEKDQLAKEEEVSGLQRRVILLDDDITRSEGRLSVESKKLEETEVNKQFTFVPVPHRWQSRFVFQLQVLPSFQQTPQVAWSSCSSSSVTCIAQYGP